MLRKLVKKLMPASRNARFGLLFFLLVVSVPVTVQLIGQQQIFKSRADSVYGIVPGIFIASSLKTEPITTTYSPNVDLCLYAPSNELMNSASELKNQIADSQDTNLLGQFANNWVDTASRKQADSLFVPTENGEVPMNRALIQARTNSEMDFVSNKYKPTLKINNPKISVNFNTDFIENLASEAKGMFNFVANAQSKEQCIDDAVRELDQGIIDINQYRKELQNCQGQAPAATPPPAKTCIAGRFTENGRNCQINSSCQVSDCYTPEQCPDGSYRRPGTCPAAVNPVTGCPYGQVVLPSTGACVDNDSIEAKNEKVGIKSEDCSYLGPDYALRDDGRCYNTNATTPIARDEGPDQYFKNACLKYAAEKIKTYSCPIVAPECNNPNYICDPDNQRDLSSNFIFGAAANALTTQRLQEACSDLSARSSRLGYAPNCTLSDANDLRTIISNTVLFIEANESRGFPAATSDTANPTKCTDPLKNPGEEFSVTYDDGSSITCTRGAVPNCSPVNCRTTSATDPLVAPMPTPPIASYVPVGSPDTAAVITSLNQFVVNRCGGGVLAGGVLDINSDCVRKLNDSVVRFCGGAVFNNDGSINNQNACVKQGFKILTPDADGNINIPAVLGSLNQFVIDRCQDDDGSGGAPIEGGVINLGNRCVKELNQGIIDLCDGKPLLYSDGTINTDNTCVKEGFDLIPASVRPAIIPATMADAIQAITDRCGYIFDSEGRLLQNKCLDELNNEVINSCGGPIFIVDQTNNRFRLNTSSRCVADGNTALANAIDQAGLRAIADRANSLIVSQCGVIIDQDGNIDTDRAKTCLDNLNERAIEACGGAVIDLGSGNINVNNLNVGCLNTVKPVFEGITPTEAEAVRTRCLELGIREDLCKSNTIEDVVESLRKECVADNIDPRFCSANSLGDLINALREYAGLDPLAQPIPVPTPPADTTTAPIPPTALGAPATACTGNAPKLVQNPDGSVSCGAEDDPRPVVPVPAGEPALGGSPLNPPGLPPVSVDSGQYPAIDSLCNGLTSISCSKFLIPITEIDAKIQGDYFDQITRDQFINDSCNRNECVIERGEGVTLVTKPGIAGTTEKWTFANDRFVTRESIYTADTPSGPQKISVILNDQSNDLVDGVVVNKTNYLLTYKDESGNTITQATINNLGDGTVQMFVVQKNPETDTIDPSTTIYRSFTSLERLQDAAQITVSGLKDTRTGCEVGVEKGPDGKCGSAAGDVGDGTSLVGTSAEQMRQFNLDFYDLCKDPVRNAGGPSSYSKLKPGVCITEEEFNNLQETKKAECQDKGLAFNDVTESCDTRSRDSASFAMFRLTGNSPSEILEDCVNVARQEGSDKTIQDCARDYYVNSRNLGDWDGSGVPDLPPGVVTSEERENLEILNLNQAAQEANQVATPLQPEYDPNVQERVRDDERSGSKTCEDGSLSYTIDDTCPEQYKEPETKPTKVEEDQPTPEPTQIQDEEAPATGGDRGDEEPSEEVEIGRANTNQLKNANINYSPKSAQVLQASVDNNNKPTVPLNNKFCDMPLDKKVKAVMIENEGNGGSPKTFISGEENLYNYAKGGIRWTITPLTTSESNATRTIKATYYIQTDDNDTHIDTKTISTNIDLKRPPQDGGLEGPQSTIGSDSVSAVITQACVDKHTFTVRAKNLSNGQTNTLANNVKASELGKVNLNGLIKNQKYDFIIYGRNYLPKKVANIEVTDSTKLDFGKIIIGNIYRNGDSKINITQEDIDSMIKEISKNNRNRNSDFDLNCDGDVGPQDYSILIGGGLIKGDVLEGDNPPAENLIDAAGQTISTFFGNILPGQKPKTAPADNPLLQPPSN